MKCHYACQSPEHLLARRQVPGYAGRQRPGGAMIGLPRLVQAAMPEFAGNQKHILIVYLAGGLSQLESWDPKPGTDTGGPFRAIPTSVPGMHICELLPHTAKQMHHLSIVRSVNTKENDHGKGDICMTTGRRQEPVADYPHLGAVGAKMLAPEQLPLPGHIHISSRGGGGPGSDAAFLGPKYASITLGNGEPPQNTARPEGITRSRRRASQRLSRRRPTITLPAAAARPTATPSSRRSIRPGN